MKILLVDDNRDKLRDVIDYIVQNCGISREEISTAQSGVAARDALRLNRFDLLILDILLPLRDEDSDPVAKTAMDILVDIHSRNIPNAPSRILGLTGFGSLSPEVYGSFRENAWLVIQYDPAEKGWQAPIRNSILYLMEEQSPNPKIEYQTDLCIVTALQSPEFEQMLRLDWAWGDESPLDDHVFVTRGRFTSGKRQVSVAMCCAPRMGMVATSLLAARMIDKLRPRFIAMTGICAGVEGKAGLGDVLMVERCWNWQSGKHSLDNLGSYFAAAPHPLDVSEFLCSRAKALAKDSHTLLDIKKSFSGSKPDSELNFRVGPAASGSAVIADGDVVKEIQRQERSLLGIEMEVYGLYAAAAYASTPKPTAFAMKSVCDFGTKIKNDEYQGYAAYTSAQLFKVFCEKYFDEIIPLAGT